MAEEANKQAKVTLHWLDKSRSQRILWFLEELQVPYELKVYQRGKDMLAPAELKQVHPLGKSPSITITPPESTGAAPVTIAESGAIVEYLCEFFGKSWIPKRWLDGKEGMIGGETEEYQRYRYFMHYAEGSLMTLMIVALFTNQIKNAPVPFFIKPITRGIAGRVDAAYLTKNFETNFDFLESQLKSSPGGGEYFCGTELSGADVMLIFPLEAALEGGRSSIITKEKYPLLASYVERIHARPAYKKAIQKIIDTTGEYKTIGQE